MLSNNFGVPNNAKLFIYDSNNRYKSLSNTCTNNPVYDTYCFDTFTNANGDYVRIFIHGYMLQHATDVSTYLSI